MKPSELLLLVFAEQIHFEVAAGLEPGLVHLDGKRADETKAAFEVRERSGVGAPMSRTTRVRLRISSLMRSSMFVDFMCLWC